MLHNTTLDNYAVQHLSQRLIDLLAILAGSNSAFSQTGLRLKTMHVCIGQRSQATPSVRVSQVISTYNSDHTQRHNDHSGLLSPIHYFNLFSPFLSYFLFFYSKLSNFLYIRLWGYICRIVLRSFCCFT